MALNFCNNNSLSAITALPASISGGGLNLISTQTASSSSTISFTSGIDSTYKEYIFKYINIHPASAQYFTFQGSTDGGGSYGVNITSSAFDAYHMESGSASDLRYLASGDLSQSTGFHPLASVTPNTNSDASYSGFLHLFDPSNTTFVKHFIGAVNAVQFLIGGGVFDGTIKMYGVL